MRNALILTGLWLGILVTAYAIVFWGNGIERPLPISVLDQDATSTTASQYTQPDSLFSVSIPLGWQTIYDAEYLEITDPNRIVSVWVLAENTDSLDEAVQQALTISGEDTDISIGGTDLPSEPWDGTAVSVNLVSSRNDHVISIRAQRPQDWTVIVLSRGSQNALDALSENLDWIWSSLTIPADEVQIL